MSQIRLLDRLRNAIRVRQYSMATEKAYLSWARRYILFHRKRHPAEIGKCEIESFLTQWGKLKSWGAWSKVSIRQILAPIKKPAQGRLFQFFMTY